MNDPEKPLCVELLTRSHDRAGFDCGEPSLNNYLQRLALQHIERNIGRTFVVVAEGNTTILGFYTLASSRATFESMPPDKKIPPAVPIPMVLLARLGVHIDAQGRGIGKHLLLHALWRASRIAYDAGVYAVEVDALHESAAQFYAQYGFVPLRDNPLHLYLPMRTIQQLGLDFE